MCFLLNKYGYIHQHSTYCYHMCMCNCQNMIWVMVIPPSLWIPYITYSWYINPISRENGRPQSEKTHGAWPKPSHFFVFRSITTNIPINPMKSPCSPWFFRQIPWNPKKSQEKSLLHPGFLRKSTQSGACFTSCRPLLLLGETFGEIRGQLALCWAWLLGDWMGGFQWFLPTWIE